MSAISLLVGEMSGSTGGRQRSANLSPNATEWPRRRESAPDAATKVEPLLQAIDRRREPVHARLGLQRQELRVVAILVQIAALKPERFLLRRLPHVALLALPRA